jgi:uncharacterized protein (TIRG00374 family)
MGHSIRYRTATSLLISGWFVSALLPARAGDVLRVVALRAGVDGEAPVPVADSLGSIVMERVLDIAAILLLGAAFSFAALHAQMPAWVGAAYLTALLLLAVFVIALLVAPPFMQRLRGLSTNRWWQAALNFTSQLVESLRTLPSQPRKSTVAAVESLLIWMCDALLLWLVLVGLSQPLGFATAAFIAFTVDIVAAVPLTPGGIGQVEAASLALLTLFGLPLQIATVATLVVRGISYWSFLVFSGIVTLVTGFGAFLNADSADPALMTTPSQENPEP